MEVSMVSKKSKAWVYLVAGIAILFLVAVVLIGINLFGSSAGKQVLTHTFSEPLG